MSCIRACTAFVADDTEWGVGNPEDRGLDMGVSDLGTGCWEKAVYGLRFIVFNYKPETRNHRLKSEAFCKNLSTILGLDTAESRGM